MKKQLKLWSLMMLLAMVADTALTACGGSDDDEKNSPQGVSILGTWRMDKTTSKGSLTIMLTFNSNGTVRYQEFDNGEWDGDETWGYTYANNFLTLISDKGATNRAEVSVLNATTLTLKDWPDMGFNTFTRQ